MAVMEKQEEMRQLQQQAHEHGGCCMHCLQICPHASTAQRTRVHHSTSQYMQTHLASSARLCPRTTHLTRHDERSE